MTSDWTAHFGLREDPFAAVGADEFFYLPPQLNQRLNLLLHLVQYSDLMLVATGPQGAGKTALGERLLADAGPRWRGCVVEGDPELDPQGFLARVVEGYEVPTRGPEGPDAAALLEAFLHGLRKGSTHPVLVVDDAHLLSPATLEEVVRLAGERERLGLAVVLLGEPQLLERLGRGAASGLLHVIDVPPLTPQQVAEYLELRLARAGHRGRSPFNDEAVQLLWKTSRGLPGLLNPAASRFLANRAAAGGRGVRGLLRRAGRALAHHPSAAGATLLGVAAAGTLAWWLGTPGQTTAPVTTTVPLPRVETVPVERPPPRAVQQTQPAPSARAAEPTRPPAVSRPEAARPAETAEARQPAPAVRAEPPAAEPAAPSRPADNVPKPPARAATRVGDEAWLLEQAPGNYTVQIFGSHEHEAVERFKRGSRLKDRLAWYRTSRNGRDWYVVVMGSYASRDAARRAIAALPAEVKRNNPWPRSLGAVQESIRSTAP
jgi:DamX protein